MQTLFSQPQALQVQTNAVTDKKFMLGRRYKQDPDKRTIKGVIVFSCFDCRINRNDPAHHGAIVALADNPTRKFHIFAETLFDTYEEAEYARLNLFFH